MDTYLTVQGNLVADPTHRSTASGAAVTHIRIASSSRKFDKATGEFRDGDAMFISVSCWRTLGVHVLASLRKGDSVVVHGRLLSRTYDDKQGVRRNVHEIDAIAVGPDLARYLVDIRRPNKTEDVPPTVGAEPAMAETAAGSEPADSVAA